MNKPVNTAIARDALITEFEHVRERSEDLCAPLAADDYQIQSIVQTSPPKWHLAHVTWFFETFVLSRFQPGHKPFHPRFDFLFNSYYQTHGQMQPRDQRCLLSRPTIEQVYEYRAYINERMLALLVAANDTEWIDLAGFVTLGLNHEQQHQELLLMDIKHNFWSNPLKPAYRDDLKMSAGAYRPMNWIRREGGVQQIGHASPGFAFDNETPRHQRLLRDHLIADRFITNAEYFDFIHDGAYSKPSLWLADGWELIRREGWQHPLYWVEEGENYRQFTLEGMQDINPHEPVCHLSYFEADAYANWAGKRLPLEEELEAMLAEQPVTGNFVENDLLRPAAASGWGQWFGDVWAWTSSSYSAYPGYRPLPGSLGEYNGKFMSNQMVLKGGSCATPLSHIRASYRNFFYPHERWAFTGLRLAEDL